MDTENKMKNALESVKSRLGSIRAGRANPALLNGIMVSYYGTPTPIQSIANIIVPEARQLLIKPFDKTAVKDIEKAINEANLGINPTNNGEMVILTIPELTMDRRKEYVKQAKNLLFENNWHDYCNNWNDARQKLPNRKIVNGEESNISGLKYLHFQGSVGTGFYDFEK